MLQSENLARKPAGGQNTSSMNIPPPNDSTSGANGGEAPSVLEEMEALLGAETSADQFLDKILASQCRLAGADGGVLLQAGPENRVDVLRIHPHPPAEGRFDSWVSKAASDFAYTVIPTGKTSVKPEPQTRNSKDGSRRHIIVAPIHNNGAVVAAAAFVVSAQKTDPLAACRDKLEITPFLLRFNDLKLTLDRRRTALENVCGAVEIISAFNRSRRFKGAAMAMCNEVAARLRCSRVSLGFLSGRCVHVKAVSNTDDFNRRMRLLQDLETVMEECLDQDLEIVHPAQDSLAFVNRSARRFCRNHGAASLVSLPIRCNGEVHAVLTLERARNHPFATKEIEAARLVCDLCGPRLMELREHDRWFGARIASVFCDGLGRLSEPKHTLQKLTAILLFLFAVFLTCAKGVYRVEAPFVFETTTKQAVVAPFDAYIQSVSVEPGDEVKAGKTVLGQLETSELRLELAALKAERLGAEKQSAAAVRDGKTAEAQIARAQIDKAAAQIDLLERRLQQGTLVAPITGRVISEDLKRQIGAPVETGAVLFEIAPLDSLQAELYVPEDCVTEIEKGRKGELASVGRPDHKIPFIVERIHPVAEVINQRNVFKVHATLLTQTDWMRPGMEGMAKIMVEKRPYFWIGSRRLINWLRMKFWL